MQAKQLHTSKVRTYFVAKIPTVYLVHHQLYYPAKCCTPGTQVALPHKALQLHNPFDVFRLINTKCIISPARQEVVYRTKSLQDGHRYAGVVGMQ